MPISHRIRLLLASALLLVGASACSGDSLKAAGEECFGSTECAEGLVCDLGSSPATCQPTTGDGDGDGDGD